MGDASWAPPADWFLSLPRVMALAALQAQWDECNSLESKAWVAARFWTQDVLVLRNIGIGAGPTVDGSQPKTLNAFLDGLEFVRVVRVLTYLGKLQATADDLNGVPERRIGVGRRVTA